MEYLCISRENIKLWRGTRWLWYSLRIVGSMAHVYVVWIDVCRITVDIA